MAKPHRITGIDCKGDAVAGIQVALKERFDEMLALKRHALKWKDPEGVHSMRVASRRLRSAISDFMPYVNKRSLTSLQQQIRSIADALGEVRDQDVAILALENLASDTPSAFAPTLHQLISARKEIRRTARLNLKKALVKENLKQLRSNFERDLASTSVQRKGASRKPASSYLNMAKAIVRDRLSELQKLSASLYSPREVKLLHATRIAAKRLRYAIELFEGCWESDVSSYAKDAAHLQTALGGVHDCDVWIDGFAKEIMEAQKMRQQKPKEAFVWLFSHFNNLRNTHFGEAFSQWNEWETKGWADKLRETLSKELS